MLINIYQRGETKTMKKSSAWFMLTPGLVILFLFLAIPLLRVLFPSIFSGHNQCECRMDGCGKSFLWLFPDNFPL